MKTYKGDTRRVVVIGPLAFKFARINPLKALVSFINKKYRSMQIQLLRGIVANRCEREFYKQHRLRILMPTYFSLFGLVNIQKSGVSPKMRSTDILPCIWDISDGDKLIYINGHTFANSDNFAKVNDHLLILDYGSTDCHKFLLKWGDKIYDNFDFSFNWEEYVKRKYPKTNELYDKEYGHENLQG